MYLIKSHRPHFSRHHVVALVLALVLACGLMLVINPTQSSAQQKTGGTGGPALAKTTPPDAGPPSAPVITAPTDNSYNNTGTINFSGTADANSTVDLFEGTNKVGTAKTDSSSNWSTKLTGVAEGTHTYIAKSKSKSSDPVRVTVDKTPPTISDMPNDQTVEATGPDGAKIAYASPTATDTVDGAITPDCSPTSGSTSSLGDTTVTCSATDKAGNKATASFKVTVQDTTAPTLGLKDLRVEATGPDGAKVDYSASASDLVDGSVTPSCSPETGTSFVLGDTMVNCSATDKAGNKATGSFKVSVLDTTAPTISGTPSDITKEATNSSGAKVSYTAPTATDAVDGDVAVSCTPAPGSTFPLGDTTVTCSATDKAGNKAEKTFKVKVQDTTPPKVARGRPAGRSFGVPLNTDISARFSEKIARGTLNSRSVKLINTQSGSEVKADVHCVDQCRTLKLDPKAKLEKNTQYRVIITTRVKDLAGNRLEQNKVWHFTTGSG